MGNELKPSQYIDYRGYCLICGGTTDLPDGIMACNGHTADEKPPEPDQERDNNLLRGLSNLRALRTEIEAMSKAFCGHSGRKRRGPRATPPRCPKCSARPSTYVELYKNHSICFGVEECGCPEEEGSLESGEPYAVECRCACGHHWRLKAIQQITQVRELFEDKT